MNVQMVGCFSRAIIIVYIRAIVTFEALALFPERAYLGLVVMGLGAVSTGSFLLLIGILGSIVVIAVRISATMLAGTIMI